MKYIVYKTTNLVNNYIYIGVHHTNDNLKFDFYLGDEIDIRKSSSYEKAKTKFQQAVKEFGPSNFRRETLAVFDTAEEAYDLEGQLVNEEFLARPDVYNMLLGGRINRGSGIKVFQYDLNGYFLKEYPSFEEAARIINADPSFIRRAVLYKYKVQEKFFFNTDKVDKLDLSLYQHTIHKVRVYRYLKSGKFDNEFESYNEAGRQSNISASTVMKCCKLGTLTKDSYYFSTIKEESFDKARTIQILTRPVYKYNSNGEFVAEYSAQFEAEADNEGCNITKAIKLKTPDINGNIWGLEKLDNYNKPAKPKNSKRKVGLFDSEGNIIKTWDSARQCAKEVGSGVQGCVQGKYKKFKGNIYKYID